MGNIGALSVGSPRRYMYVINPLIPKTRTSSASVEMTGLVPFPPAHAWCLPVSARTVTRAVDTDELRRGSSRPCSERGKQIAGWRTSVNSHHYKILIPMRKVPSSNMLKIKKFSQEELGRPIIEFFCFANVALSHATQSPNEATTRPVARGSAYNLP